MFTISIVASKGGVGKSTIAVGLAVAAARAGRAAAVIDLDPQCTAAKWKDRRTDENPAVVSAQASRLAPTLATARNSEIEFAFVDTAGRNDDSALAAARAADLVLVPSRNSIVEIETLPAVMDMLRLAGSPPTVAVLNCLHPSTGLAGINEARQALQALYGLKTAPVHLCQRNAYAEAMITGSTPQELDAEGRAAQELEGLFKFVCEAVNMRSGEHVEQLVQNSATA